MHFQQIIFFWWIESLKGSYDAVLFSLWSVTSWLCIDKIPEVAKTKVSKPKRYSWSKSRPATPPKMAHLNTPPHVYVTTQIWSQCILWTTVSWTLHRWHTIIYSIWKIMCFLNIKTCQHILLHQIMIFKKHHVTPLKWINHFPQKMNTFHCLTKVLYLVLPGEKQVHVD